MKAKNFLLKNVLFVFVFISLASLFSPADAQRTRYGKSCGQGCASDSECRIGTSCINGACYETGCNPAGGDPPCCKSQRPRNPRPQPTTPPGGGGNPNVPNVPNTTPGKTNPTGSAVDPRLTPGNGQITPPAGGGGTAGDCSGPVEGTKDGKVDLADFNLLRKELSGSSATTACDFDTNGLVDLLDFNIFRIAFIAQK